MKGTYSLFTNRIKQCNGWILSKNNNEKFIQTLKINRNKQYSFYNIITEKLCLNTIRKFARSVNVSEKKLKDLIRGKLIRVNEWILSENKNTS